MRKKIILLSICIIVLAGICIRNIMVKSKETSTQSVLEKEPSITLEETGNITRAEAFRLISYLYYTDYDRDNLPKEFVFQDVKEEDWYYEYMLAMYCAGFDNQLDSVGEDYYIRPLDLLNQYETHLLFKQITESFGIDLVLLYQESGLDITTGTRADLLEREQFLSLYETLVSMMNERNALVHMEELYFLAEDEEGKIVTQNGKFIGAELCYCKENVESITEYNLTNYMDRRLLTMVSEDRILYLRDVSEEATVFENVYLLHGEGTQMTAYIEGVTKQFELQAALSAPIDATVGNITCKQGKISAISIKPDAVSDKVILANEEYIELENYGKVQYDDNFKIYKVYGELKMEQTNAILVGYTNTKFVLNENRISAALITEPITATNLRVMLKTSNYKGLFHEEVKLTCTKPYIIEYGEEIKEIKAGKETAIDADSKYFIEDRVKVYSKDQETPIQILSIKRSQGNPSYRGSIEIAISSQGLTVINEVPIEEYLYAVLPSEMPISYGMEALKTQAVCARSYAYRQLLGNQYSKYGAHIDDSSSYQVYNNYGETKETIQAVKETYGQAIEYEGEIITAYYFSTSCGYTSSMSDVWGGNTEYSYLVGEFQSLSENAEEAEEETEVLAMGDNKPSPDFSSETAFREFLTKNTYSTLEEDFAWYRWTTKVSFDEITANLEDKLRKRYEANPNLILTQRKVDGKTTYVSEPISTIGTVTGVEVAERKSSGIITQLLIHGTKESILVASEYNIRSLLAPRSADIIRQDESAVTSLTLLPSAFFVFDVEDGRLKILGGGYGHGVGMSQNGVKALSDLDYVYEDILAYYYKGTKLTNIYE